MSAHIINLQKDLLVKMMNNSPDQLLQLVLKEECNSILEMKSSDLKQLSMNQPTLKTRQNFLDNRKKFWEKEFKENQQEVFDSILIILKEKVKTLPPNFDYINKLLIEESIH